MVNEDRLTLSLGGELAAAVRAAAEAAGVSPAQWAGSALARHLATAGAQPAPTSGAPGAQPGASTSNAPRSLAGSLADPAAWEQLTDPSGAMTALVPRGWQNRIWVVATPVMKYPMLTCASPDGSVELFSGDSEIPFYVDPAAAMMGAPPGMKIAPPTQATQFLAEWVAYRYGSRPGFRVLSTTEEPAAAELVNRTAQRDGTQLAWATGARLSAEWNQEGSPVQAVIVASTAGVTVGWTARVFGVIGSDPASFVPALLRIAESIDATPAEKQRMLQQQMMANAQHQATMGSIQQNTAAMTARHQQRMADIQASGQAFQAGMAQRQQVFDAGVDSWRQQQAASDRSHAGYIAGMQTGAAQPGMGGNPQRDFLNAMREETTVTDAYGYEHQVEAGADRYYHHEYTNTWVGLQEHQDIVEVTGNDDFREGTIQN